MNGRTQGLSVLAVLLGVVAGQAQEVVWRASGSRTPSYPPVTAPPPSPAYAQTRAVMLPASAAPAPLQQAAAYSTPPARVTTYRGAEPEAPRVTLMGPLLAAGGEAPQSVSYPAVYPADVGPAPAPLPASGPSFAPVGVHAANVVYAPTAPLLPARISSPTQSGYQDPAPVLVQTQGPPPDVPPPPPSGGAPAPGTEPYNSGIPVDRPVNRSWWDGCRDWFGMGHSSNSDRSAFQSDACFNMFISPVTNPFYNEDPRALTELRPIFMYQTLPGSNPVVRGGTAEFFGTQARIAFTDRFSVVMNKLGGVHLDPGNPLFADNSTGFAEIWLGPKYTFYRSDSTNTVAAGGLTFQIPTGAGAVYQNTGNLSLVPYVSLAQSFGRTSYGTFNYVGTAAYSFAVDNQRSDSLNMSTHVDFDVANLNKFYPLIELNWTQYTGNGKATPYNFEGADLANLGAANVSGSTLVTVAAGMRYKFSEHIQAGVAGEWAVTGRNDLNDFRLTVDMIFRY